MLHVKQFTFSVFGENTFLLIDDATRDAVVIDPGMQTPRERLEFDNFIAGINVRLTKIINTHLHLDHCFGANYVKGKYGVKLAANPADAELGLHFAAQCSRFGLPVIGDAVEIDLPLVDGNIVHIGESELTVIATPGHSQGGLSFYDEKNRLLFVGDTLFKGSIGRTDLPGGNQAQLIESIRTRLMVLPDNTSVFPGHDRLTSIANERRYNPYI